MNIVELKSKKGISGDNVDERIAEAVKFSKDRVIKNVVIVMIDSEENVLDCWANNSTPFAVVGAIESVKREFMDSCIEARE